jgi:hypothetical protein
MIAMQAQQVEHKKAATARRQLKPTQKMQETQEAAAAKKQKLNPSAKPAGGKRAVGEVANRARAPPTLATGLKGKIPTHCGAFADGMEAP